MKIHYFQRYHQKENVATANTMLLLSRLYAYSPAKFFRLLKENFFSESFEPELTFRLQEKGENSVLDAAIMQEIFKIAVETKLSDWFYAQQLENHLQAFGNQTYRVLMTIAPEPMAAAKRADFEKRLQAYNDTQRPKSPIVHINTTFEKLANALSDVLDDRDDEMQAVLEDYRQYCYDDGLIAASDAWKYMRMRLAGTTLDFNTSHNVYYDKADHGFRPHDYLGLYSQKSIRAIGKICASITAVATDTGITYHAECGELTEDRKTTIELAMKDAVSYGYDIRTTEHRYFFVEKFYETDFRKISPRAPMGTRIFDLTQILETDSLPETENIAELLKEKTWE